MPGTPLSILDRLTADPKADGTWDVLVLAALEGPQALAGYLDTSQAPKRSDPAKADKQTTREPQGAYLKSITVEGFRGIGNSTTLELPPGPGLTLVVGRNGSGKSSFAEGLELLVTGDTYRWANRTKVWREGWRNLHHKPASIEAEFHIEGETAPTAIVTKWEDDADLAGAKTHAQTHGKKQMNVADLGWEAALQTYRPFLSYNELGSMLDDGPSKLFDALAAILGLEKEAEALETLAEARRVREKAHKEAALKKDELLAKLKTLDDDRSRSLIEAMEKKDWGLDAVETALVKGATGNTTDSDVQTLRQLANLQAPQQAAVATVVHDLREAQKQVTASAKTLAAHSKDLADLLDQALKFHTKHGNANCPICGKPGALDAHWHEEETKRVLSLRQLALDATKADQAANEARKKVQQLFNTEAIAATLLRYLETPPARHPEDHGLGTDPKDLVTALDSWRTGLASSPDLDALAAHVESKAPPLIAAVESLRTAAQTELAKREDRSKPVAPLLAAWLTQATQAQKGNTAVKPLKTAEAWLKEQAGSIRNERFAPIKEKAQQIWSQLRLQSNVALEDIRLTGSAARRSVDLDVTVDGTKGPALGVISQGEQNALALSLFIPRATLPGSPFRFVVIDDPVQSMDPSRIDGLARALHETASQRQVVVFTHDDRLPEAVRRLAIPATVIEVMRREGSAVELRTAKDPVSRYIEDAMAVARTDGLPPQAAKRVVPGLCRLAVDAACTEAVRRRRLGRGEPHAGVEDLLAAQSGSKALAALALFDDAERAGDVLPHLNKQGKEIADVFRMVNEGAHQELPGHPVDLVRGAERLAQWMRTRP